MKRANARPLLTALAYSLQRFYTGEISKPAHEGNLQVPSTAARAINDVLTAIKCHAHNNKAKICIFNKIINQPGANLLLPARHLPAGVVFKAESASNDYLYFD